MWRETRSALLQQAHERLPAEYREGLALRELEDLSYRDIATIAEIPAAELAQFLEEYRHQSL